MKKLRQRLDGQKGKEMAKRNDLYCRLRYNEKNDEFRLEISTDDGETWGLSVATECRRCTEDPDGEANFIHFHILKELERCIKLGYQLV